MQEIEKVIETTEMVYDEVGRMIKSTSTTVVYKELGKPKSEQE